MLADNLKVMSDVTHHMKYARYIPEKQRRETYQETASRNMNMHIDNYPQLRFEIINKFKFVFDKKVLPSMRSMQFSGDAINLNPARMFNCTYLPVSEIDSFWETMFLLLCGCGVGFSVQQHHVEKLPEIRKPTKSRRYLIGDSIEGWADAVKVLMKAYFADRSLPLFDYRGVRAKGERLITSGGKAPGPEPLKVCLDKIKLILDNKENGSKLSTLEAHDIQCIIADAVLAGGIRRSALISLFNIDDEEMLKCKSAQDAKLDTVHSKADDAYDVSLVTDDGKEHRAWLGSEDYDKVCQEEKIEWYHLYPERARSNNSMTIARSLIDNKTFKEKWEVLKNSGSGEPGFYFTNDKEYGVNPCCEIALKPYQFCNLTSINVSNVESQEDLNQRAKAAAFVGTLQASYTDFHYLRPEWKKITEKEALLGVSLTGLSSINHHDFDWKQAAESAVSENKRVAELLNINPARRVTCIKPEGTGSLVLGTSSGIHAWHNDYYKRRIRVGKNEAIYSYLQNTLPELVEDEVYGRNAVITIPIKAPDQAITREEDVVDFMERIKFFSENWVNPGHNKGTNTHNVSATISVKSDEWAKVASWLWKNQDSFNGLSFLPYDNGTYVQAPFEDCTESEYKELTKYIREVDLTQIIEEFDETTLQSELACSGGSCEVI